jgi:hypothetical protein
MEGTEAADPARQRRLAAVAASSLPRWSISLLLLCDLHPADFRSGSARRSCVHLPSRLLMGRALSGKLASATIAAKSDPCFWTPFHNAVSSSPVHLTCFVCGRRSTAVQVGRLALCPPSMQPLARVGGAELLAKPNLRDQPAHSLRSSIACLHAETETRVWDSLEASPAVCLLQSPAIFRSHDQ